MRQANGCVVEDGFEEPILELEHRIEALSGVGDDVDAHGERERLREQLDALRSRIFSSLTAWQTALVARHSRRPYTLDYVQLLIEEFEEIHGDRRFSDDPAIVCGLGRFR